MSVDALVFLIAGCLLLYLIFEQLLRPRHGRDDQE